MKAKFSEFSYGFAVTYEILNELSPTARSLPIFPSLKDEGDIGYDLEVGFLGLLLFLQFKLSDCLIRPTAKYWGNYGGSYFRFPIRPLAESPQHNLLKKLSEIQPHVYYLAPRFWMTKEFSKAFKSNKLADEGICVPLSRLPYVKEDEDHCITFTDSGGFVWHSPEYEEYRGDFSTEHMIEKIRQEFSQQQLTRINREYVLHLRNTLIGILGDQRVHGPPDLSVAGHDQEPLRDIRHLLTTFFSVDLVVLRGATDLS